MTARDVKDALRARHPAIAYPSGPGPWTCLEEWMNIDLLAVAAWTKPHPARVRFARIGYEVKVSRPDYRRELERPGKRRAAVGFCHEFYFAVPAGLLRDDERAWEPPPGLGVLAAPFHRRTCPGAFGSSCRDGRVTFGIADRRPVGTKTGMARLSSLVDQSRRYDAVCPTCRGQGWVQDSDAARAGAPRLWVPPDVGLIEVRENGSVVVAKKAPLRDARDGRLEIRDSEFGQLVRWVSVRPDPRHAELRREIPS